MIRIRCRTALHLALGSLLALAGCLGSSTHSVAAEWKSLFDGKTLAGWTQRNGTAKYTVVDGTIRGETNEGSPNSFLCSDQQYGDFELEFEVKVNVKLNSGVQIRSRQVSAADLEKMPQGKKAPLDRVFGPQVEIMVSPGHSGYVYGEAMGTGWLSKEPSSKEGKTTHEHMKNGEWNKFRIVAKGPRIQTWINDQPVADLTHEDAYKSHPKGFLGLQVHGIAKGTGPFEVAWRNIRIRE